MLSEVLRPKLPRLLTPVVRRIPLHPNVLSILGLAVAVSGAAGFAVGAFRWAALGILVSGALDMLDGASARARKLGGSAVGSFLDSAVDRVADNVLYLGVFLYYYFSDHGGAGAILAVLAVSGSNIASYLKALAEVHGIACNVGLVKRAERLILLFALGILGPEFGIFVLSVLVLFSAHSVFARAVFVYHRLRDHAVG